MALQTDQYHSGFNELLGGKAVSLQERRKNYPHSINSLAVTFTVIKSILVLGKVVRGIDYHMIGIALVIFDYGTH